MATREWKDEEERKNYRGLMVPMIGLVTGAILFLPSIAGMIQPPLYWDALLYVFWICSVVSVLLLCAAWYFAAPGSKGPPDRLHGLGNIAAVAGLASLAGYVGTNLVSDRTALPSIDQITVSPISPRPGARVQLAATVSDQDGDDIRYSWTDGDRLFGDRSLVYWSAPMQPGTYSLGLAVQDDNDQAVSTIIEIVVEPHSGSMPAAEREDADLE